MRSLVRGPSIPRDLCPTSRPRHVPDRCRIELVSTDRISVKEPRTLCESVKSVGREGDKNGPLGVGELAARASCVPDVFGRTCRFGNNVSPPLFRSRTIMVMLIGIESLFPCNFIGETSQLLRSAIFPLLIGLKKGWI